MRVLTIALKDLRQFTRNIPMLVMSLAAPLVLTAIMGFAFGGLGGTSVPTLQVSTLQVANLDLGQPGAEANLGVQIVEALQGPDLAGLVQARAAADEATARAAVDGRQSEMALIIPGNLTAAVMSPESQAADLVLYHDPALTLRPKIVAGAVQRLLDAFWSSRVAALVTAEQLNSRGAPPTVLNAAAGRAAESLAHEGQSTPLLTIEARTATAPAPEGMGDVLTQVSAGMLVFFMFYTAATAAETILKEEEDWTLQRLFTVPAPRATILAGKFASVFLSASLQTLLLVVAGALLFGTKWGAPAGIAVHILGSVTAAAGLGLLLMSFAHDTRQAGYLLGGTLAVLGMAGGLFTVGLGDLPPAFDTIALLTPQGWAMKGWSVLIDGGGVAAALGPAAVSAAIGIALFALGASLFRRRFA